MRKKIIDTDNQKKGTSVSHGGIDLEHVAQVEISSEDEAHPIESALTTDKETGWKAAEPGEQTIRIIFDAPQNIRRIQLLFREKEQERSQEFLLRWLEVGAQSYKEIVRQQYNFSPPHTTEESEEYTVNLPAATALELTIIPDTGGKNTFASLAQIQLS